jgi:hypothetical protein
MGAQSRDDQFPSPSKAPKLRPAGSIRGGGLVESQPNPEPKASAIDESVTTITVAPPSPTQNPVSPAITPQNSPRNPSGNRKGFAPSRGSGGGGGGGGFGG